MLLNQAISAQQALYANIQAEIEALQSRQREIQSYLQTLGGIESKMESAALLVQEAIAEIKQHCPDELPAYQTLINGFFDSTVAGQIAPSSDPEPNNNPTPPTPPTPPTTSDLVTVDAVAQPVVDEATTGVPAPTPAPVASNASGVDLSTSRLVTMSQPTSGKLLRQRSQM